MEWQPIETAPKDGEAILLFKPDERMVGEYIVVGIWDFEEDGFRGLGMRSKLGYFSNCVGKDQGYPTHWMPLPEPPNVEK